MSGRKKVIVRNEIIDTQSKIIANLWLELEAAKRAIRLFLKRENSGKVIHSCKSYAQEKIWFDWLEDLAKVVYPIPEIDK